MPDGTGDVLTGPVNHPGTNTARPLLILIHGMAGSAESFHVALSAAHFLGLGHPVLRLELRGAGASQGRCREGYHAGRTEDLRAVIGELPDRLTRKGVIALAYSLGANMLLKYLGEEGAAAPLRAAVSVSAPIDLAAATACFQRPRNALYHRYMLAYMKREALAHPGLSESLRSAVRAARTVYEYDDRYVAPRYGFAGADGYYARCMARQFLPDIAVPTLVIHAADDPWIPIAAYRDVDWASNPNLRPLFPAGGGHVGFHGRGSQVPWHDRCAERFVTGLAG